MAWEEEVVNDDEDGRGTSTRRGQTVCRRQLSNADYTPRKERPISTYLGRHLIGQGDVWAFILKAATERGVVIKKGG